MTPTQREAALRLIEFLEMHWCEVDMPEAKAASLLRELLAEPQGEPAAWLYRHKTEQWKQACVVRRMGLTIKGADGWHECPLYTHPPQQRKLLSEEQIASVVGSFDGNDDWNLHDFARAIERAHGITGEPT